MPVMSVPSLAEVLERQSAIPGSRFGYEHVSAAPDLYQAAREFLAAYQGTFQFLVDVKRQMLITPHLFPSKTQAAGVLNCMAAEARRSQVPVAPVPQVASVSQPKLQQGGTVAQKVPNGTYTIVFDGNESDYVTLRLRDPWEGLNHVSSGTQVAQFMSGSDNEANFTGMAFVQGEDVFVWSRFRNAARAQKALKLLLASNDPAAMGLSYALQSGRCWRCRRKLTRPDSISDAEVDGLGPECRSIVGLSRPVRAVSDAQDAFYLED